MTTYHMHYTDNSASWRRLGMLASLYWPGLKIGLIICAIVPAVLFLLASAVAKVAPPEAATFVIWPVGLLVSLSPLMLTKRDYRYVSAQLPVTTGEKLGFLLLTFWIVVPVLVYISSQIGNYLGVLFFDTSINQIIDVYRNDALTQARISQTSSFDAMALIVNGISNAATIVIVLYYVVHSRTNRTLYGILSYFVTTIVVGFISGIVGAISGISEMVEKGLANNSEALVETVVTNTLPLVIAATTIVLTVAGVIYFVKLYKHLRNSGF